MTDSDPTQRTDRTDRIDAPAGGERTTESARSPVGTGRTGDGRAVRPRRVEGDSEDDVAFRCRYCGDPFVEERHLALHRGLNHANDLTETEREAYRDAYADEEADLKRFRLVSLGALVVLYFGFLFVYAVVT
ncbi:hypothetical protein [Haloprofundus halobius]|uniref:hypothetical protein n=1 Tax=Haloprofundus halobius TaxID=2876194 RepID=UPI001CCCCAD6|nr:hypothetical protein [Haloprofundus halobius]